MAEPKLGKSLNELDMHYSVGAICYHDHFPGQMLLLKRKKPPLGYAGPAGHVDVGENSSTALIREIKEETGYDVLEFKLLVKKEVENNTCRQGITVHDWELYACRVTGDMLINEEETDGLLWTSTPNIYALEPVWKEWIKYFKGAYSF